MASAEPFLCVLGRMFVVMKSRICGLTANTFSLSIGVDAALNALSWKSESVSWLAGRVLAQPVAISDSRMIDPSFMIGLPPDNSKP
jgi:hypothetical protein